MESREERGLCEFRRERGLFEFREVRGTLYVPQNARTLT
jgi:hypothetical protein